MLDAIDRRDWNELAEELGDFLLQAVFYAQMGAEENLFRIDDALDAINQKLIRRHPHVFGEQSAETAGDVKRIWGEVKAAEKKDKGQHSARPARFGAARAAGPGGGAADLLARRRSGLRLGESRAGASRSCTRSWPNSPKRGAPPTPAELENELGDMLFVLVNLARFVKVDPEQALRKTNAKFRERFGYIERKLAERGKTPQESNIEEMEALWQEAKR